MAPLFCILSCESPSASDKALCKLAQFLGLRAELIPLRGDLMEPPEALREPAIGGRILALACTTLRLLIQRDWFADLVDQTRFLFAYDFATADGESPELKWLTRGVLSSVTSLGAGQKQFTVHANVTFGNFPVSGQSWLEKSGCIPVFSGATVGPDVETYISANGHPLFVTVRRGSSVVFLLTDAVWVDLDTAFTPESSLRPWYAQLVAASIFLRSAFGPWCWTSPVTGATFIVDDPYLKERYGFVHYEALMRELTKTGSALTVAFIPYNYRRSAPQTINLLRRHAERFSIAVHGCDHTSGEFASLDERWLVGTAECALARMEAHARKAGMPFDKIMVFPQGRFSTKGISALKKCAFDAVVNTTPWPVDYHEAPLTVRDLLDVAVTRYNSFPIFVRRYPRDVFDYAFDALFQKPLLAVEHHGYFRSGYEPFSGLVREISTLSSKVTWMPLGRALASSCVVKKTANAQYAVRHFLPLLQWANPTPDEVMLSLEKPEQDGIVEAVLVNGQSVPFEICSGLLRYEARLGPGEQVSTNVICRSPASSSRKSSWKYRASVSTRRFLSEVRDNHLARSERVLSVAQRIKSSFLGP